MKSCYTLILLVVTMLPGCGQQSQPAAADSQPDAAATPNQTEAAKAHVQQYIDRLMGGDQTVKQGLLGMDGVDFDSIESIQITSAVPTYLPDGRKVDDMVRVVLSVRGYDSLKRRTVEKNVDRDVLFENGHASIVGSAL